MIRSQIPLSLPPVPPAHKKKSGSALGVEEGLQLKMAQLPEFIWAEEASGVDYGVSASALLPGRRGAQAGSHLGRCLTAEFLKML